MGAYPSSPDILVDIFKKGKISLYFSNLLTWQWWSWSTMLRSTRTTTLAPLSYQSHLPETPQSLARWHSSKSFESIFSQLAITGGWGSTGYQEGLSLELRSLELNTTSVWMKTAFWSPFCTCCSGKRYLDLYKRLWQRREGDGSLQRRFRRTSGYSTQWTMGACGSVGGISIGYLYFDNFSVTSKEPPTPYKRISLLCFDVEGWSFIWAHLKGEGYNCRTDRTSGDGSWSNVAAQRNWILKQLVPGGAKGTLSKSKLRWLHNLLHCLKVA